MPGPSICCSATTAQLQAWLAVAGLSQFGRTPPQAKLAVIQPRLDSSESSNHCKVGNSLVMLMA